MSFERDGWDGPLTFCCDECGDVEETHCSDFSSARLKIKAHGWKIRKEGENWLHFCWDCAKWRRYYTLQTHASRVREARK